MSRPHALVLALLLGVACSESAPAGPCDFSARYSYGPIGGDFDFGFRTDLAPGNKYTHSRTPLGGGSPLSCSPPMPTCEASDVISADDIEVQDLANADVQAALAMAQPPLYGRDLRPVDGTVFEFKRGDGRGFQAGDDCDGSGCTAIPAGIAQLVRRLQALDRQQLVAPECASVRRP